MYKYPFCPFPHQSQNPYSCGHEIYSYDKGLPGLHNYESIFPYTGGSKDDFLRLNTFSLYGYICHTLGPKPPSHGSQTQFR